MTTRLKTLVASLFFAAACAPPPFAGNPDSGSASTTGGATGGQAFSGQVVLSQLAPATLGGGVESSELAYASAVFAAGPAEVGACAGTFSGSCCYTATLDAGMATGSGVGAGTLAILDHGAGLALLPFSPTAGYRSVSSVTQPTLTWSPSDTLTVTNSGAAVHPFTGTVVAPSELSGLLVPNPVPLTADLVVKWTGGSGNNVTLNLACLNADAGSGPCNGVVSCTVPDSDNQLTVPQSLLSQFRAGDLGLLRLFHQSTASASADNAVVTLSAAYVVQSNLNLGGTCASANTPCQADASCCGGTCSVGSCRCSAKQGSCQTTADCCGGLTCAGGTCG